MKIKLAIVLTLVFLFFELITISHYGINWDEPTHYLRGQAFLHFFLTGKKNYDDLPKLKFHYPKFEEAIIPDDISYWDDALLRRSLYQNDYYNYNYFMNNDVPLGHPPLNDILASFSNYIFYQKLGIVGDIESYHIFPVIISSILVAAILLFSFYEFGFFAGIVSFLSLVLYPLFLAESHFNVKDPVEASLYALTILSFYYAVKKDNWKIILLSSIFAGFALGTKFNILFGFITLFIWIFITKLNYIEKFQWFLSKKSLWMFLLYPFITISIIYFFWPYLWQNPRGILNVFLYYRNIGETFYQPPNYLIFGFINTYAIQWIALTTPVIILLYSFLGIFYCLKNIARGKNKILLLILIWFSIPILRVSIPNVGIYGGVRQIMEYIPAMALLSGLGANYLVLCLKSAIQHYNFKLNLFNFKPQLLILVFEFLIIASFIPITLTLTTIHPNENVYFNSLIGGLKGAKDKGIADWGTTLGSSYRQGIRWINDHAEKDADVALFNGLISNIPRIWIRSDINFNGDYYSGSFKKGEYLIGLNDYSWDVVVPKDKRDYIATLDPIYKVKVDGVAILTVWKNDGEHTKKNN